MVKRKYQEISVGLTLEDRKRLAKIASSEDRTRTEVAREAIRWYLDNYEAQKTATRDSEISQSIRYATDQIVKAINSGVDRICKMLARQGAQVGTLYELSWAALPNDPKAEEAFEAAANRAKQEMRRQTERDEQELVNKIKKVVRK